MRRLRNGGSIAGRKFPPTARAKKVGKAWGRVMGWWDVLGGTWDCWGGGTWDCWGGAKSRGAGAGGNWGGVKEALSRAQIQPGQIYIRLPPTLREPEG